ncbi:hypothetical protein CR513_31070, partial [Mucuna pruriens]
MVLSRYAKTRHCHRRTQAALDPQCHPNAATIEENEARGGLENQRSRKTVESRFPGSGGITPMSGQHRANPQEGWESANVDLNRASPKDNFPLPHIDLLVDNIAQHSYYFFMDGFSGYNQIRMTLEDKEKTTFITMWGMFCYKVMSFGLKNIGTTYQRAIVTLFHDMMHKEVEVYVDDMIAKSKTPRQHISNLRKLFERLRKYKLRLNLAKCTFGVGTGNYWIEPDLDKVKVIRDMLAPKIETKLTATCSPIFKLLQKNQKVEWNQEFQEAFEKVKQYLESPPVLVPIVPDMAFVSPLFLSTLEVIFLPIISPIPAIFPFLTPISTLSPMMTRSAKLDDTFPTIFS